MKKLLLVSGIGLLLLMGMFCGKDTPNGPGPGEPDETVIGAWEGEMLALPPMFKGAKIFVDIYRSDSAFSLVSLNPSTDTVNPAIKDTSLVMTGKWHLNTASDSILLVCDTSRIIDTTAHILKPNPIRGQVVPMLINISTNKDNGDIEWIIALKDLVPLAPLLGINLTGISENLLKSVKILIVKKRQL